MKSAVIIGHQGQDGRHLSGFLRHNNYVVVGVGRQVVEGDVPRHITRVDITQREEVVELLAAVQPDELYFLAALHHSSEDVPAQDEDLMVRSFQINTIALDNVLSAVVSVSPKVRVFYAASSRVFGEPATVTQNEDTPLRPICPYGISKAAGIHLCNYYRATRNVYVSVGILYNHESPLRSPKFLSRKISSAAVRISRGYADKLAVRSLGALVDWGYAPDYVRAMWEILQLRQSDVFVVGTGVLHSVQDFAEAAFRNVGLEWKDHVVEHPRGRIRREVLNPLCANSSKLTLLTGWKPLVPLEDIVRLMIRWDLEHLDCKR